MRAIQTNDFEAANVQYIEMWLMDPFIYQPDHKGGEVYSEISLRLIQRIVAIDVLHVRQ